MRKLVVSLSALVLSGRALTPEQVANMQGVAAAINESVAERNQERAAQYAEQLQYLQNRPALALPGGAANPFSPTIRVMPVNQFGMPLQ